MLSVRIPRYGIVQRGIEIGNIYSRSEPASLSLEREATGSAMGRKSRDSVFAAGCVLLAKNLSIYNERDRRRRWKLVRAKTSIGLTRRRSPWVFRAKSRSARKDARGLWRRRGSRECTSPRWTSTAFLQNTLFLIPVRMGIRKKTLCVLRFRFTRKVLKI